MTLKLCSSWGMFSSPSEEKKEDSAYQLIYSLLSLKNQQTLAVPCNKTLNNKTMCWLKGHKVKLLFVFAPEDTHRHSILQK